MDFEKGAMVTNTENQSCQVSVVRSVNTLISWQVHALLVQLWIRWWTLCVQRSVVDAIMDVTRERPWLWVIIAIVVIAPLFMCVIYCCVPPSQVVAVIMAALSAHTSRWIHARVGSGA